MNTDLFDLNHVRSVSHTISPLRAEDKLTSGVRTPRSQEVDHLFFKNVKHFVVVNLTIGVEYYMKMGESKHPKQN